MNNCASESPWRGGSRRDAPCPRGRNCAVGDENMCLFEKKTTDQQPTSFSKMTLYASQGQATGWKMAANGFTSYEICSVFRNRSSNFSWKTLFHFEAFELCLKMIFVSWPQKPALPIGPKARGLIPEAQGHGPQGLGAWGTKGLEDQATWFFLNNSCSAFCSGRDLVLCAVILFYVQFQSLLFSSVPFQSLMFSAEVFCSVTKSSVPFQGLMFSSKGLMFSSDSLLFRSKVLCSSNKV